MAIVGFALSEEQARKQMRPDSVGLHLEDRAKSTWGVDVWLWRDYVGKCLHEREANHYDDSDFYMTIWDDAKGEPFEIEFATTRGWTYPALGSAPDATPEVQAKYEEWKRQRRLEGQARRVVDDWLFPTKGKLVKIVGGRKYKAYIESGVPGQVIWVGIQREYARRCGPKMFRYVSDYRVGVRFESGDVAWLRADQVQVVGGYQATVRDSLYHMA